MLKLLGFLVALLLTLSLQLPGLAAESSSIVITTRDRPDRSGIADSIRQVQGVATKTYHVSGYGRFDYDFIEVQLSGDESTLRGKKQFLRGNGSIRFVDENLQYHALQSAPNDQFYSSQWDLNSSPSNPNGTATGGENFTRAYNDVLANPPASMVRPAVCVVDTGLQVFDGGTWLQFDATTSGTPQESLVDVQGVFVKCCVLRILGGLLFLFDTIDEIDSSDHVGEQLRCIQPAPALLSAAC